MQRLSWFLYGVGVLPVLATVLLDTSVGVFQKTLMISGTLFIGALIAAIAGTASVAERKRINDDVASALKTGPGQR